MILRLSEYFCGITHSVAPDEYSHGIHGQSVVPTYDYYVGIIIIMLSLF